MDFFMARFSVAAMNYNTACMLLLLPISCGNEQQHAFVNQSPALPVKIYRQISDIPVPVGYTRKPLEQLSFGTWLRQLSLSHDNTVYLYNGKAKEDQQSHVAVINLSIGNRDLQQCADAVIRLRAEYLFHQKRFSEIVFTDNAGRAHKWTRGNDRAAFNRYLNMVYGWCGSASLEKQLNKITLESMQPGDVLIKGGFPGHAMIVADMATNDKGETVFMLAQGFMPAQNFHIVKNPGDSLRSPWYRLVRGKIYTPGWEFHSNHVKTW